MSARSSTLRSAARYSSVAPAVFASSKSGASLYFTTWSESVSAEQGLLISCATPATSVPSAESFSACAALP